MTGTHVESPPCLAPESGPVQSAPSPQPSPPASAAATSPAAAGVACATDTPFSPAQAAQDSANRDEGHTSEKQVRGSSVRSQSTGAMDTICSLQPGSNTLDDTDDCNVTSDFGPSTNLTGAVDSTAAMLTECHADSQLAGLVHINEGVSSDAEAVASQSHTTPYRAGVPVIKRRQMVSGRKNHEASSNALTAQSCPAVTNPETKQGPCGDAGCRGQKEDSVASSDSDTDSVHGGHAGGFIFSQSQSIIASQQLVRRAYARCTYTNRRRGASAGAVTSRRTRGRGNSQSRCHLVARSRRSTPAGERNEFPKESKKRADLSRSTAVDTGTVEEPPTSTIDTHVPGRGDDSQAMTNKTSGEC